MEIKSFPNVVPILIISKVRGCACVGRVPVRVACPPRHPQKVHTHSHTTDRVCVSNFSLFLSL